MDTLPSSEFRKRFASLREPTEVTVNGHVIGSWVPVPAWARPAPVLGFVGSDPNRPLDQEPMRNVPIPGDAFHQEPWSKFTPVPKPTRRK